MRKPLLSLLLAAPALVAQSIVPIPPQQCVWRAGDDPAWAAPHLDESGWLPYAAWKAGLDQPRIWIRCHANLEILRSSPQSAIQVRLVDAYELYLDGRLIGSVGDLTRGTFNLNSIRSFPFSASALPAQPSVLALRFPVRSLVTNSGTFSRLFSEPLELRAGDAAILQALRASEASVRFRRYFLSAAGYGIMAVLACMLLVLFLYDRSRLEFLLLGLTCLFLAALRFNELAVAAYLPYSVTASLLVIAIGNVGLTFTQFPFFFALAGRRVPLFFRILIAAAALDYLPNVIEDFAAARYPESLIALQVNFLRPLGLAAHVILALSPFIAFFPYRRVPRPMRPLAALCMLWGLVDLAWFLAELSAFHLPGVPDVFAVWGNTLLQARAIATVSVLAALLTLLFRDQRRITEERAALAGEMASAREIQQYLIPEKLPPTPGLAIHSVYHPAREVGGDFFQVLPDPRDGSTLIVVGDVAGKGLQAGMLAALIVGSIRTAFQFTSEPGRILALLNERLQGRGLVTCLAMRIQRDGAAEIANAGHLPPYINGRELALEGALPLGALPAFEFPTSRLQLSDGQTLLLVSDGVVEARNAAGDLFGFERTAAISSEPAESIARAAQAFGQEDDITVLTLARAQS